MGLTALKSDSPQRIYVEVTANHPLTKQILDWFEALNQPPPIEPVIWWQCQTALKEAFDNIVEHAHAGLPLDTPIAVEATRFADAIELRLWDCGPGFDLRKKLESMPDLTENVSDRGRGLHLVNRIAHSWSYIRAEDGRNCFFMVIKTRRFSELVRRLEP
jgi:serine/threonine-protein kinase RsbW